MRSLWSGLARREAALVDAVTAGEDHEPPRAEMVGFLHGEVFAHLQTEEAVLYNAARGVGAHALVATLEADHKSLLSLTEHIAQASTGLDAAPAGTGAGDAVRAADGEGRDGAPADTGRGRHRRLGPASGPARDAGHRPGLKAQHRAKQVR